MPPQIPALMRWAALLLSSCLVVSTPSTATDLFLDGNGSTPGSGVTVTATWGGGTPTTSWNSDPTGGAAGSLTATTTSADKLFFSAGSDATTAAITMGGAVSADSLTFQEGASTFTANQVITLGGGITVDSTVGANVTQIGNASGSTKITASGVQTWANNNGSALTNRLIVGGGTINALVTIAGNGIVQLGNTGTNNTFAGSGGFQIGTAGVAGTAALSTSSGGYGSNSFFLVNATLLGAGSTSGAGSTERVKGLAGRTFFLQGDSTLSYSSDTTGVAAGLTLDTNSTLTVTHGTESFPTTIASVDNGAGGTILTKAGSGLLWIRDAGTYSGGTVISGGTLRIGSDASLGAVPGVATTNISFTGNATLQAGANTGIGLALTPSGTVSLAATRTLSINSGVIATLNTTPSTTTQSMIVDGKITGPGALTKSGAGTLTLNGANDYAAGTTLSAGALIAGTNTAFGSGDITATGASSIQSSDSSPRTFANNLIFSLPSGTITLTLGSAGTGNLGFGTYSGAGTGGARVLSIDNALTTFTDFSGTFGFSTAGTGALIFTGNHLSASGGISIANSNLLAFTNGVPTAAGQGNIAVNNGGVLGTNGTLIRTLGTASNNTRFAFSGSGGLAGFGPNGTYGNAANNLTVRLNNGTASITYGALNFLASGQTLVLGNARANGMVDFQNGLDFNGAAQTVRVDRSTLAASADVDARISGILSNGGLTKTGEGTLELTSANTYAVATTISAGRLLANNTTGSATGSSPVAVNGGILGGTGSISGDVTVNAGGKLAPGASIESLGTGSLAFDAGELVFELNTSTPSADLVFGGNNSTLTLSNNPNLTLVDLGAGASLLVGTKFTLIGYDGAWNNTTFAGYGDDSTFSFANNPWLINYDDTSAGSNFSSDATAFGTSFVTLTVVPEPSILVLLGVGILGTIALHRFRRGLFV